MAIETSKSMLRPLHETAIRVSTVYEGLLTFFSYVTWLSKAQGEGVGLWEQESSPVVAGINGSKTWECVLACGQLWVRLRGGH